MIKIAVVVDTWFPYIGGGQINAFEISRRIASKKIHIDVITRATEKDMTKLPKYLKVIKLGDKAKPLDSLSQILFSIRASIYLIRNHYDLIHAHAFLPGISARLAAIFRGTPTVFTVHGTALNANLNGKFKNWIEKKILTETWYKSQITVSLDFLKFKNVNKKINYIPNAVDINDFDKTSMTKSKKPQLIFVGRLHSQKNLKTLIRAMLEVTQLIPEATLTIVGKGPLKKDLKSFVNTLKLNSNVNFVGELKKKDLVKAYKQSWIFILPSLYEGQPLTLLEAWAAKLPVIVSATGDCTYLVKEASNGLLLKDPGDYKKLAQLVIKLLRSKNLERMGENGYNLVRRKFSWDISAQHTRNIYEKLTQTKNFYS